MSGWTLWHDQPFPFNHDLKYAKTDLHWDITWPPPLAKTYLLLLPKNDPLLTKVSMQSNEWFRKQIDIQTDIDRRWFEKTWIIRSGQFITQQRIYFVKKNVIRNSNKIIDKNAPQKTLLFKEKNITIAFLKFNISDITLANIKFKLMPFSRPSARWF